MFNKILSALKRFFSGTFGLIASIASIIGLIIVFVPDENKAVIALSVFVIFLIIILFRIFFVVETLLSRSYEKGFYKFATYVRYCTNDGNHIAYDLYKYVQCKTISLSEYEHDFYWSGTRPPVISSKLQKFISIVQSPNGGMDKATFEFKTPLVYNDFGVIHIRMDLDDTDNRSQHYCEQTIKEEVHILNFRIELLHLANNADAKIMRKRLSAIQSRGYEVIGYVKFDTNSKSYEHLLFNPEMGYAYRIEW